MHTTLRKGIAAAALLLAFHLSALAQDDASLFDKTAENYGWTFDNGREFPGAAGGLSTSDEGNGLLKIDGDFSKGGNYVQAIRKLVEGADVSVISFKIKLPAEEAVTLRIGDASGQCHQVKLKLKPSEGWQSISFPIGTFLAEKGASTAAEMVAKYENWGGAGDAKWHGPCTYISVLLGGGQSADKKASLCLADFKVRLKASSGTIMKNVRLDEVEDGETEWGFSNGQEFPGATGKLETLKDDSGNSILKLSGDFTKGGAYVGMGRNLEGLSVSAIRFKVKSENATKFGLRLEDSTKQTHQVKGMPIKNDGEWHQVVVQPSQVAGGEHWGGANDGKWHQPASLLFISVGTDSSPDKTPAVLFSDIEAEAAVEASVQAASYANGFEGGTEFPSSWKADGSVKIVKGDAFKGGSFLLLEKTKEQMDQQPCGLLLDSFPVKEGVWELSAATKSSLYSPDSSYNGMVNFAIFDGAGKKLNRFEIAIATGDSSWKSVKKRMEIPAGASFGRFELTVNKTYGTFGVDDLSASYVSPSARANASVKALKIASKALGNLFQPGDAVQFDISVECSKPLPEAAREAVFTIRDYWGAELAAPRKVKLEKNAGTAKGIRGYKASLDFSDIVFETGKYYELHGEITEPDIAEPYREKSSFAILPVAITKKYPPFDVPFTSRDWDNRLKEYILLSDRLGLRVCGLWSGWNPKPPYEPHAPCIELCKELGMGVVLGTPGNLIEYHHGNYKEYTEESLREGAKNLVNKYKDYIPLVVSLGNEPHPNDEARAQEMIAAYKAMYAGIKAADPKTLVIGTSSGPMDILFKNGFQPYQDVYDFHVYEDPNSIRGAFKEYKRLFNSYSGSEKPIWSTEIGLNSQGMTRRAITIDLIRKFAVFFAEGGANMSWFDLLYPNSEEGSNSDSFNVFNSKYCLYSPRLDAIAYYNMVNGICVKKFTEEKVYDGGVNSVLFRDKKNACLLVIWKDKGRQDAFIPLEGVGKVKVVRIDGGSIELDAKGKGLTLSLSEEPFLLLFDSASLKLASTLEGAQFSVAGEIPSIVKGGSATLSIACAAGVSAEDLTLTAPPSWTVRKAQSHAGKAVFEISAPEMTSAREGRLAIHAANSGGELYLPLQISGRISLEMAPLPFKDGASGIRLKIINNAPEPQDVQWCLTLGQEITMAAGTFKLGEAKDFTPSFSGPSEGTLSIEGKSTKELTVLIGNLNPLNIYNAKLEVSDASGKLFVRERAFGGFAGAPKAAVPVKFDGKLGDPAWRAASIQTISEDRQYYSLIKEAKWKGPQDLSGKLRFLWDDNFLYLGMELTDDVFRNPYSDGDIWNGDGLQILVDPCRGQLEKPGKYDYAFALGTKGPQAFCYYSADPSCALGEAKDIVVKTTPTGVQGGIAYEIAIPWARLAPFKPAPGASPGLGVIIHEDDGPGRGSFMGWFGCAHSKQIGLNGDLILESFSGK